MPILRCTNSQYQQYGNERDVVYPETGVVFENNSNYTKCQSPFEWAEITQSGFTSGHRVTCIVYRWLLKALVYCTLLPLVGQLSKLLTGP